MCPDRSPISIIACAGHPECQAACQARDWPRSLAQDQEREEAVSVHTDTPVTRQASHNRISYPIHHSRGREPGQAAGQAFRAELNTRVYSSTARITH